ncbi:MAG: heavy metal translocating P-type ATPase [Deltaproteobacteria bacterium]|jgi:Cd2+/Zn2+-exporting ATPase|nr:heavy metal translocating P-type ATPase [Deltaproteobacteria bacterium]
MSHYCPVCGVVHDAERADHHHSVHSLGSQGVGLARGERGEGGQASAAEGEEDGEPAPINPGLVGGEAKTVRFLVNNLCCSQEAETLRNALTNLAGVLGVDFNLSEKTMTIKYTGLNLEPVESLMASLGLPGSLVEPGRAANMSKPILIPMLGSRSSLDAPKLERADANKLALEPKTALDEESPLQPSDAPSDNGSLACYHVPGMCCNMEVNLLRSKLTAIAGLGALSFNLNDRVVAIENGRDHLKAIAATFQREGFEAALLAGDAKPVAKPTPWKRYILATILAFLAEGLHWRETSFYVVLAICLASFILSGFEVYKEGLLSFKRLRLDMNALMSLAVTGAVLIGEVPEGAMVLALFSLAEALEARSLSKARAAIASLFALAPDKATARSDDGQWREIKAEEVAVGTLIQIRPGEKLPLDGQVVSGYTTIDQAPVTGESVPVDKNPGDPVFAGTINGAGSIEYVTTAEFKDSTLAKVAAFVESTEAQKAPVQRLVDRFAAYYTPAVFALAFLVALIPPLYYGGGWGDWLKKALVLLVISCPCSLVISVPVTILSGLAAAARKGLIIKGGAVLEEGRKLVIIALDKTGTITIGRPRQTSMKILAGVDEAQATLLAASLAARSDHPVSRAIYESYPDKNRLLEAQNLMAYPGKGIGAQIGDKNYLLGNHKLLPQQKWAEPAAEAIWREMTENGQTVVTLIENEAPLAIFAVADALKEESLGAIEELRKLGLKIVMLTGDNESVARSVAKTSGVDRFYGELLPEDKAGVISQLKKEGKVGMAGDGINDAPALVSADIGFAMAMMGTDVAIETASVAIMDDKLSKIPAFVRLARSVWTLIIQNFVVVFVVKSAFLLLTMVGFTSMWMAVIADIGVCMVVVANGLRAIRK